MRSSKEIYDEATALLQTKEYSVWGLLTKMNVKTLCTTDDPTDTLEYHQQIAKGDCPIKVLPAFRPDKAMNVDDAAVFNDYVNKVYVVEFFFTTCPSICPIMNRRMVEVQNEFFGNPNFGITSFTINPEIDTPEVLKTYAQNYGVSHPNWNFLTGDKDEILKLSNEGHLRQHALESINYLVLGFEVGASESFSQKFNQLLGAQPRFRLSLGQL